MEKQSVCVDEHVQGFMNQYSQAQQAARKKQSEQWHKKMEDKQKLKEARRIAKNRKRRKNK